MPEPDLQEIHDFLVGLAGKAGPKIVAANPSTVDTKKNCMTWLENYSRPLHGVD